MIETFKDVQALTHVMDSVGYRVIYKGGKGYVLEDKDGNEVTNGHKDYADFLAVAKEIYDVAKIPEVSHE